MMDRLIHDLRPVDFLVADAEGPPGQRAFFLQARKDGLVVTLLMEKDQVALLASSIVNLMSDIEDLPSFEHEAIPPLALEHPLEPLFRVGQMGLGYERSERLFALFMQGLAPLDDATAEVDAEGNAVLPVVRLWATGGQMQAFSEHALNVVEAGRPICPLCQEPIDPDGHLCPRSNGHADPIVL